MSTDVKKNTAVVANHVGGVNGVQEMIETGTGSSKFVSVELPAHKAAHSGDIKALPGIFEKGGVPMLDANGNTPLHVAAISGNEECLRWLLTHTCIPIRAKNKQEETPAHLAASRGKLTCLLMLFTKDTNALDAACDRNADHMTTLHLAALNGQVTVATWLLMEFRSTLAGMKTISGLTVLHIAAERGHLELVKMITKSMPKLVTSRDNKGQTPLHYAAKSGRLPCIKYMADHGVLNPRSLRSFARATPLHAASVGGNLETLKWIVGKMGPLMIIDKMDGGITPLHIVSGRGNVSCLKWMLRQQPARKFHDVRDTSGRTPAYYAAEMGKAQCLSVLIDDGVDMHSFDKAGNTPYTVAVQGVDKECAMLALSLTGGKFIDPKFTKIATHENDDKEDSIVSPIIMIKAIDEETAKRFRTLDGLRDSKRKKKRNFFKSRTWSREQKKQEKNDTKKKSASVGQAIGKQKNTAPKFRDRKSVGTSMSPTDKTLRPLTQLFQPTNRLIALPKMGEDHQITMRQNLATAESINMANFPAPRYEEKIKEPEPTVPADDNEWVRSQIKDNWTLKEGQTRTEFEVKTEKAEVASTDTDVSTIGDSFNWLEDDAFVQSLSASNKFAALKNVEGKAIRHHVDTNNPKKKKVPTATLR